MNNCNVKILSSKEDLIGEYEEKEKLEVNVYNCSLGIGIGSTEVQYNEFLIKDLKNSIFYYSPMFISRGTTYSLTQYNTYSSNYYFKTTKWDNVNELNASMLITQITFYHPMLIHFFDNPCLEIKGEGGRKVFEVITKDIKKRIIPINKNNIKKLELSGDCYWKIKDLRQCINLNSENYVTIYLEKPIKEEDLLKYIYEFDVFVNAYFPIGLRSYETMVNTINNKKLFFKHKFLGKERTYNEMVHYPIKMDFFEYLEVIYKKINYREEEDKNKFLLMDFKKPISIEDKFIYYFRFIDMYMGKKMSGQTSNFGRISFFIDEYKRLFETNDILKYKKPTDSKVDDIEYFKNIINSIRNHLIHEGYYFKNGKFDIKIKNKFVAEEKLDYIWLYRITRKLRLGAYIILYKEVLGFEIDEIELEYSLKD